jgi:aconitate hydratase
MGYNVAQKLIGAHLVEGEMIPEREIGLRVDQTLTQDATGTLVMLELEAMDIDRAHPELAVQYVDHNILQEDHKNPEDHLFLYSACRRYGIWFSRPGNGVSHPAHQERFSKPGKFLLGADSHTPAAGSMGMLAIGAGGLEVAMALAGYPLYVQMPRIWGVNLIGRLPDWTSAKDIILEMLRRYTVKGGVGQIIEYTGPGIAHLSAMDRHVIANMGAELGATTTVFPSDETVKHFLKSQNREEDWIELRADSNATYDMQTEIDLGQLEPLIAMPSSPDNVVPVREVAGEPIYQAYVGSSANPGYRDFAVAAEIVKGKRIHDRVSFDICPTTRQTLENLVHDGHILSLLHAGARLHQAGCNGCIGMGQAPATGKLSLRTVPRNFPGRSGTPDDRVCLVSPETAAASALTGTITDPRTLDMPYPRVSEPEKPLLNTAQFVVPLPPEKARQELLTRGANIVALPEFDPLPDALRAPVLLKVGDNISTDEILSAGAKVLPYRSNIPAISQFVFERIDPTYPQRAAAAREQGGHVLVGGRNYGQGSSREHAALAPRYLGLQAVIAKSFARIHWQNLANFAVLPLVFDDKSEYDRLSLQDTLQIARLPEQVRRGAQIVVENVTRHRQFDTHHDLSARQVEMLLAGGLINAVKQRRVSRKEPVAVPSSREGSK